MTTKSTQKFDYGDVSFGTYGATGAISQGETLAEYRTRSWNNAFPNRRTMLKSLVANGYLPTTGYTDNTYRPKNSGVVTATGYLANTPGATFLWRFIPTATSVSSNILDSRFGAMEAKVLEKLQSKLSGHGANVPVSLGEARQTIGMIGDAAKRLYQAYRHVRNLNFYAAAVTLGLDKIPHGAGRARSVKNNWLAYRYGWRLVVYDAVSLMETVYDALTERQHILKVGAMEEYHSTSTTSNPNKLFIAPNGMIVGCVHDVTTKTDLVVRGGYTFEIESAVKANSQAFGLLNPFSVAWELIPWSFVVDWFVNVGTILESLTAFSGKLYLDGFLCREIEVSVLEKFRDFRKQSGIYLLNPVSSPSGGKIFDRRFRRNRQNFTAPSMRLTFDLNTAKVADAIALLGQIRFR